MKRHLGTLLAFTLTVAPLLAQNQQASPDPNASTQSTQQLDDTAAQNKAKADAATKKSKSAKKASAANKNAAKQQSKTTDAQQKAGAANAANSSTPAPQ